MGIRYLEKVTKPVDEARRQLGASFTAHALASGARTAL